MTQSFQVRVDVAILLIKAQSIEAGLKSTASISYNFERKNAEGFLMKNYFITLDFV